MAASTQPKRSFWLRPEIFLIVVGIVVGILFSIFIPYGAGFDEEAHLVRVFDISGLHLIPNRGVGSGDYTLSEFYSLSYQRRYFQTPAFDQFDPKNFDVRANWGSMADGSTHTTYFPLVYLPQAAVAGILWRVLDVPILPGVITIRLVTLLLYLFLCYLSLRLLPIGKWIFLVLALSPMALFQAATINADVLTNGICFLFIAYLFRIYYERERVVDLKQVWILALLTVLVGCVKPGTFLILVLLLLLCRNHFSSRKSVFILIASVMVSVAISLGWSYTEVALLKYGTSANTRTLMDEIKLALANLPDFMTIYFRGIVLSFVDYYVNWVGVYGYWVGNVPVLVYVLYPAALLSAIFAEGKDKTFTKKGRIWLLVFAIICLAGMAAYEYVYHYTPGVQTTGVEGRYFIQFTLILFLAPVGLFAVSFHWQKWASIGSAVLLLLALSLYTLGLYRTYYTLCVYPISSSQQCNLPIYKNIDLNTPYVIHVTAVQPVIQSFTPQCAEISAVKVRVQSVQAQMGNQVRLTLIGADGVSIASENFALSARLSGQMLVLPVKAAVTPDQTQLKLSLALVPGGSTGADLGLLGRAGSTIYPQGDLWANGVAQDGDLIFQYSCSKQP